MAGTTEVSDAVFDKEVVKSDLPVLVDFWAPWCGPCHMVSPLVEELAGEYVGKVKFFKMNVDDNPESSVRYGIRSIPTMLIFKGGKPVGQIVGAMPKKELQRRLEASLAAK